jgi:hypothetical protein
MILVWRPALCVIKTLVPFQTLHLYYITAIAPTPTPQQLSKTTKRTQLSAS